MARRFDNTPRVRGPYWSESRQRWYAQILVPKGDEPGCRPSDRWLGQDEKEAQDWVTDAREKMVRLRGVTTDGALSDYRTWLMTTGHRIPSTEDSATETVRRLRLFFESAIDYKISSITETVGERLYVAFTKRTYTVGPKKARRQKPYQPGHHRHTLAQAKSFMDWCVRPAKLITSNPLEDVKGIGVASVGKEQLTGDESIRFYEWCAYKAHGGDEAALALVMLLLMALRQGDVRKRVVRDVDLEGTVLRVGVGSSARSKTKKGDRPRRIPLVLQPLIKKLTEGRSPLEPLFKTDEGDFRSESWMRSAARRFCKAAGVPYVCPHGLKGTAGTLASEAGALADQVAEYLSHQSKATQRHYVANGAAAEAVAAAGLRVITGGRG